MSSYRQTLTQQRITKSFINTASFPTSGIAVGTKAIDLETDTIYYWNGNAWYKLSTTEAAIPTFNLTSNLLSVTEGELVTVTLATTNLADTIVVPYSYYYQTSSGSTTPITGNFTIGTQVAIDITVPDDDTLETNEELVFELDNGKASLTIPINQSTIISGYYVYGEQLWTTGDSGSWIVPEGVTSISVAALGGGNYGREQAGYSAGGGGGALAYSNNISVTPGEALTYYTTPLGAFLPSTTATTNGRSRLQRNNVDIVSAEPGMINEVAIELGRGIGNTGGRASASVGDVTVNGANGSSSGFYAAGGSAAAWSGTNPTGNSNYTTGRGGYGTGPFGTSNNGSPDYDTTPPDNSNRGALFGGGGGGVSTNAIPSAPGGGYAGGGGGFLRVVYPGDVRRFPDTQVGKTGTNQIWSVSAPKFLLSSETFTITVNASILTANTQYTVRVSGLPGGDITQEYLQPSFSVTDHSRDFTFTAPAITTSTPVTIELDIGIDTVISLDSTGLPEAPSSTYIIDFDDAVGSPVNVDFFFENLGFTGSTTTAGTFTIENGSLNTSQSVNGPGAYYVGGDTVRADGDFEISFWLKWNGTRSDTTSAGIFTTIPGGSPKGITIDNDQAWLGTTTPQVMLDGIEFLLGDNQWRRYSIRRENNIVSCYRDGFLIDSGTDNQISPVQVIPFKIGDRYIHDTGFNFVKYGDYSMRDIRINSEGLLDDYGTAPALVPDYTVSVTNSGNNYLFTGRVGLTNYNNSNQPNMLVNKGDVIQFNINPSTSSSHPFYIKTQQSTGTANQAPSVTGNGTRTVIFDTANVDTGVYGYQCSIHFNMWNTIRVQ